MLSSSTSLIFDTRIKTNKLDTWELSTLISLDLCISAISPLQGPWAQPLTGIILHLDCWHPNSTAGCAWRTPFWRGKWGGTKTAFKRQWIGTFKRNIIRFVYIYCVHWVLIWFQPIAYFEFVSIADWLRGFLGRWLVNDCRMSYSRTSFF